MAEINSLINTHAKAETFCTSDVFHTYRLISFFNSLEMNFNDQNMHKHLRFRISYFDEEKDKNHSSQQGFYIMNHSYSKHVMSSLNFCGEIWKIYNKFSKGFYKEKMFLHPSLYAIPRKMRIYLLSTLNCKESTKTVFQQFWTCHILKINNSY